jgi:hypothetical protein
MRATAEEVESSSCSIRMADSENSDGGFDEMVDIVSVRRTGVERNSNDDAVFILERFGA